MTPRNSFPLIGGTIGCLVALFCIGAFALAGLALYNTRFASLQPVDRIAFLDDDRDVHIINPRGEHAITVTSDANNRRIYTLPTFSPDSQHFVSTQLDSDERGGVRVADLDQAQPLRIGAGTLAVWS